MTGSENIIKEFEKICDYTLRPHEFRVLNDVLALLKEQDAEIRQLKLDIAKGMRDGIKYDGGKVK